MSLHRKPMLFLKWSSSPQKTTFTSMSDFQWKDVAAECIQQQSQAGFLSILIHTYKCKTRNFVPTSCQDAADKHYTRFRFKRELCWISSRFVSLQCWQYMQLNKGKQRIFKKSTNWLKRVIWQMYRLHFRFRMPTSKDTQSTVRTRERGASHQTPIKLSNYTALMNYKPIVCHCTFYLSPWNVSQLYLSILFSCKKECLGSGAGCHIVAVLWKQRLKKLILVYFLPKTVSETYCIVLLTHYCVCYQSWCFLFQARRWAKTMHCPTLRPSSISRNVHWSSATH